MDYTVKGGEVADALASQGDTYFTSMCAQWTRRYELSRHSNYSTMECHRFKVVLIGKSGCGKTSLFNTLVPLIESNDCCNTQTTIASSVTIIERENMKIAVWDTAGQEKYRSIIPLYSKDADIVVFCRELGEEDMIVNYLLTEMWNGVIMHVATKCDLLEEERKKGMLYCSAKTADNTVRFKEVLIRACTMIKEMQTSCIVYNIKQLTHADIEREDCEDKSKCC